MTLRFALVGAQGRMGVAIKEVLAEDREAQLDLCIVRSLAGAGSDGRIREENRITSENLQVDPIQVLRGIDVMIDFSTRENLSCIVNAALEAGVPLLVGVTGLTSEDLGILRESAKTIPVAYAANTSLGIAVMSSLCEAAARMLPSSFDVEVVELHHKQKKDAPSGTALHLAGRVSEGRPESALDSLKDGGQSSHLAIRLGQRKGMEIGMAALRGGDVVGDHTVYFLGEGERIELTHRCTDRRVFARGAVYLAKRLRLRKPGFYSVAELIR